MVFKVSHVLLAVSVGLFVALILKAIPEPFWLLSGILLVAATGFGYNDH